jgi:hypothetical protein
VLPATEEAQADVSRGQILSQQWCSQYHGVRPNQSSANPDAPSFSAIALEPSATEYPLRTFLRVPHKTMPNFVIKTEDIDDIVDYIASLKFAGFDLPGSYQPVRVGRADVERAAPTLNRPRDLLDLLLSQRRACAVARHSIRGGSTSDDVEPHKQPKPRGRIGGYSSFCANISFCGTRGSNRATSCSA